MTNENNIRPTIFQKAKADDFLGRFREIVSDPINFFINRVPHAGFVENDMIYLHNGNKVPISGDLSYYGSFSDILIINRGVHEPLEEYVFQEVLKALPSSVMMIELGSYWGHYSMWLKKYKPESQVYLIEPDKHNMLVGQNNFKINGFSGNFIQGFVGKGEFMIDPFLKQQNFDKVNLLHVDIQGYEVEMLKDASNSLLHHAVDYIFISTHSQLIHEEVVNLLESFDYRVEVNSDFDNETTSFDGLVFSSSPKVKQVFNNFQHLSRKDIPFINSQDWITAFDQNLLYTNELYQDNNMSHNPYQGLPANSFWTNAVANSTTPAPEEIYKKKWGISKEDKIATAGSCFAQHIGRHLRKNEFNVMDMEAPPHGLIDNKSQLKYGYSMYSARYGNIYTARQLLQLAQEAFGEHTPQNAIWEGANESYYDAIRPNVEPQGLHSIEEVKAHRVQHIDQVREMFETMDLFIFTLGLTESWVDITSNTVFPTAPGVIAGTFNPDIYKFKNFQYNEILADFYQFRELILSKQTKETKTKFLLTVSPVPLTATASNEHALLANTYSKSVLRAVAGELSMQNSDIDYFPSYEIISNPWTTTSFYKNNKRSVEEQGIEIVMNTFFQEHLHGKNTSNSDKIPLAPNEKKEGIDESLDLNNAICEEEILDAFSTKGIK
ncbi:MAG: GSCFA domain-containing protein [Cocleimonas sp.]